MKRPIRKKAYHRALRRKEPWALEVDRHPKGSLAYLLAFHMRTVDLAEELTRHDSLFNLIPKDDGWRGGYIRVPFNFGREDDPKDTDPAR